MKKRGELSKDFGIYYSTAITIILMSIMFILNLFKEIMNKYLKTNLTYE